MYWKNNVTPIPELTWEITAKRDAQTLSKDFRPLRDSEAYTYTCNAKDFLAHATYLCKFTNAEGTGPGAWNHPTSRAITVRDYVKIQSLVDDVNGNRNPAQYGRIDFAFLITMHCSTCDRVLVIDGVHRLVRIATEQLDDAVLTVTELSGSAWPPGMPDMNKVCAC